MYLGIDIGGTKTLLATFDATGALQEQLRFPTPHDYRVFLHVLANNVAKMSTNKWSSCCVAAPGLLDRSAGVAKAFGNLPWKNIPIQSDIADVVQCTTIIENDANLAGLSEARLIPAYQTVLYLTISTGIGGGFIVNGTIDPDLEDSEPGLMVIEYHNKLQRWQDFASGRAIYARFGKRAEDITDQKTWSVIAHALSLGIIDVIATTQPDVIVFGGGVSSYFERLHPYLKAELNKYNTPMTAIPPLLKAKRPESAVIYGCYELLQSRHG